MNQQPQPERKATAKIIFDLDMAKKGEWVQVSRNQGIGLIAYIIQAVEEKMDRDRAKNG